MTNLAIVAAGVILINVPFGFWRAGVRKFSLPWFLAVHGAVPLVVALRLMMHVGFGFASFPVLVGMYFSGQYVGGRLKKRTLVED
jgi:hypothetical protein